MSVIAAALVLAQGGVIVGDLRIQVLSPSLIRIEQKGPEGFEDRPTFHIANRSGFGSPKVSVTTKDGMCVIWAADWQIFVDLKAKTVADATIWSRDSHGKGKPIFDYDPAHPITNSAWLPAPEKVPKSWAIADSPRLIPGPQGLTPDGNDPTSDWDVKNDAPDLYVFLPHSYDQLRKEFLHLTGPVEMPPLYALGYTDSRYYAYEQQEALNRMDEYRKRQIPIDTFVVDTDWRVGGSHGYDVDTKLFPDMPGFFKAAHGKHIHVMFNDHPEPQSKSALDPKELNYRYDNLGGLLKEGLDIWWYDRNWGVSLIDPLPGLRHEVWGMKLYHDMTLRAEPSQRPLIMSNVDGIDNGFRNRPPNVATHRYPVQWTGDTRSEWSFLRKGVENAVFEGVQGLNPWVNEDLGGHVGQPVPDLYIRYLQFGSVCPFMRVHCTKGRTREPWAFGPDAERIVPEYIKMRYRLMPLFYASARQAYETGEPILRRLDLQYPMFKEATADDQFLIGDSLLVAPIVGGKDAEIVPASAFPQPLQIDWFANKDLTGDPTAHDEAKSVNFDWGTAAPNPKLPVDYFSARMTGRVTVPADHPYRLQVTADDGVRMWIDGKLLVDKWEPQDSVTTEAPLDLQPGSTHDIKIEYMELQFNASLRLRWHPVTAVSAFSTRQCWIPPGRWTDVWSGATFTGPRNIDVKAPLEQMPMFLRDGAIIPIGPDVQWTGQKDWSSLALEVVPGNGQFSLYEDDGSSLGYEQGQFRKTPITVTRTGSGVRVSIGETHNSPGTPSRRAWTIRVLGLYSKATLDGQSVRPRTVSRSTGQPFRNANGEPTGDVTEVQVPASPVGRGHEIVLSR